MLTSNRMRTRGVAVSAAIALGVVFVAGVSYELGRHHGAAVVWHTGQAQIGDHEVSVMTKGWVYGFMSSVPRWIDASGATHTDSWPDCMNPAGTQRLVTFATATVTVTGATWRQVLLVDCRAG